MPVLELVATVIAVIAPICSAAYVVGRVRAELEGLRSDVDDAHASAQHAHQRIDHLYDMRITP